MTTKEETTESVLQSMLTENTGRNFLDSGGAYGRNWERNQGRDFEAEPSQRVDFCYYPARDGRQASIGIDLTLNVYHFLQDNLSFDSDMDSKYQAFCKETDPNNESYDLELIEQFWAHLSNEGYSVRGIYGEGEPCIENTYNHESNLSQVLQFGYATIATDQNGNHEPYIFLQVHGGCDVRGGYTGVRVFAAQDLDGTGILDAAKGSISCSNNPQDHYWYTDDANHWYFEGTYGCDAGKNLEEYSADELGLSLELEYKDQKGYCPFCLKDGVKAELQ